MTLSCEKHALQTDDTEILKPPGILHVVYYPAWAPNVLITSHFPCVMFCEEEGPELGPEVPFQGGYIHSLANLSLISTRNSIFLFPHVTEARVL